ncbi:hypothetical protein EDD85DRAFT_273990 [Armillaria nabsnona]|nr:hypothetical protein EDD85DRAFT_273990 [Armillaria nabsnona]
MLVSCSISGPAARFAITLRARSLKWYSLSLPQKTRQTADAVAIYIALHNLARFFHSTITFLSLRKQCSSTSISFQSHSMISIFKRRRTCKDRKTAESYFPPEIFDTIVDELKDDTIALKQISLVSKGLSPRTRVHLFSSALTSSKADCDRLRKLITHSHASLITSPHSPSSSARVPWPDHFPQNFSTPSSTSAS